MRDNEPGIPAWLVCEDILNRIKAELITQAMDVLQEAINSKAIEVNGSLVTLPDRPSDTDMYMFIINKLIEEKGNIIDRYRSYLSNDGINQNPDNVQRRERLKKFLLSVEQISLLMQYSQVFNTWIHDVALQINATDPSDVIKNTLRENEPRMDVLNYVLNNKKIENEHILTEKEREILKSSITGA